VRIDFAARDAANRRLGSLGEEFVVEVERLSSNPPSSPPTVRPPRRSPK
jgi:hypothetical protein